MKKKTKIIIAAISAFVLVAGIVLTILLLPKKEDEKIYDAEKRPLTMAIGALDGKFNPFFYTAQNDGTVVGMTQVSMLASNAAGEPVCGEDRPTVAKDFAIKEVKDGNTVVETEYSFLIKNGMKFSDGMPLTVMDVLFNLYVYLDEAYIGSSTLYSTDIKGLTAYQLQDPSLADDAENNSAETFRAEAYTRYNNLIDYCEDPDDYAGSDIEQVQKDIITIINFFKEEVKSDWTSAANSFASRDKATYEYTFTETWQAYLFNEGIVALQYEDKANGAKVPAKDADGKYITTLDPDIVNGESNDDVYKEPIEAYANDPANIKRYTDKGYSEADAKEELKREWAVNYVFRAKTGFESVDVEISTLEGTEWNANGVSEVALWWASGTNAIDKFTQEARTAFYEGKDIAVKTISGITVERVTSFNGEMNGKQTLSAAHDVVKIKINGVDPKAIWNFSISVAPMHYYSTNELYQKAWADYQDYLEDPSNPIENFGVKFADAYFFGEGGLEAGDKNRLPVGAGAYKASSIDGSKATAASFFNNKYVYYERNTYFETMGEQINNAVIKYVKYNERGEDTIVTALINKEIDYGMPSGNVDNATEIAKCNAFLDGTTKYRTNGYGYVGINPKFVPDINVRRAIMKALDTHSTIESYYLADWATPIYRPMSMNSWAYPTDAKDDIIGYTNDEDVINELITDAGYEVNSRGIYEKDGKELKLTFTIAGNSTEHPAYTMFTNAEQFLEGKCHMDITVTTDVQALKKLASGNLAVWAAAWSSSIDPDMYQVYHKESKATSVKNWNYAEILNDTTGKWDTEKYIIEELSKLIDQGRQTTSQKNRSDIYSEALDKIMELAVELPTYQRYDYEVYNKEVIDSKSLTQNPSAFVPLLDRLWEVSYN